MAWFVTAVHTLLRSKSPTFLTVTLRMLREARASQSLETCLNREYAGCKVVLRSADFFEGVRAAVIDKDRNPAWSPGSLQGVSEAAVESYFARTVDIFEADTKRGIGNV